jgi:hypothetical protein
MATKKDKPGQGDSWNYQIFLNRYCEIEQISPQKAWQRAYDEGFFSMAEFLEAESSRLKVDLTKSPNTWPIK